MSNHPKLNPVIEIDVGGEKVKLTFNLWTLYKIEEATGKNALDGATWLNPSAKDVISLLWAAWLLHDPKITMEDVAKKIDLVNIGPITEQLGKAFELASGDDNEKNERTPETTPTTPENPDAQPTG